MSIEPLSPANLDTSPIICLTHKQNHRVRGGAANEVDKQDTGEAEASSEGEGVSGGEVGRASVGEGAAPRAPRCQSRTLSLTAGHPRARRAHLRGPEYVGLLSEASLPWVARTLTSVSQAFHALGSWRLAFRGL